MEKVILTSVDRRVFAVLQDPSADGNVYMNLNQIAASVNASRREIQTSLKRLRYLKLLCKSEDGWRRSLFGARVMSKTQGRKLLSVSPTPHGSFVFHWKDKARSVA